MAARIAHEPAGRTTRLVFFLGMAGAAPWTRRGRRRCGAIGHDETTLLRRAETPHRGWLASGPCARTESWRPWRMRASVPEGPQRGRADAHIPLSTVQTQRWSAWPCLQSPAMVWPYLPDSASIVCSEMAEFSVPSGLFLNKSRMLMIAAVYVRKSTDQSGVADEQKSA